MFLEVANNAISYGNSFEKGQAFCWLGGYYPHPAASKQIAQVRAIASKSSGLMLVCFPIFRIVEKHDEKMTVKTNFRLSGSLIKASQNRLRLAMNRVYLRQKL